VGAGAGVGVGVGDGVVDDAGVEAIGSPPPPPEVGADVVLVLVLSVERRGLSVTGTSSIKPCGAEVCRSPTIFLPLCTWKGP
jgi:hypothetical protein